MSVVLGAVPAATPTAQVAGPSSGSSWNGRKTSSVLTGAVGLAGVGVGTAFGLVTISDWSDAKSLCSPGKCPSPSGRAQALTDQSNASTSGLVSTVAFGVGAAGIAGALMLWFWGPSEQGSGGQERGMTLLPLADPHGGGLAFVGRF